MSTISVSPASVSSIVCRRIARPTRSEALALIIAHGLSRLVERRIQRRLLRHTGVRMAQHAAAEVQRDRAAAHALGMLPR